MGGARKCGDHRVAFEGSGVVECGEVRDLAWGAGGVEGGDEPPQAALVTHSARNEEQQAVLYFG